jgi:hypothetical protein
LTWDQIIAAYPNATISGPGGTVICVGYGGHAGVVINVDRVVIGLSDQLPVLYDFEPALLGDANYDGAVDVGDLGILAANYGGSGKTWTEGDFNGDALVDVGDLGILAANYGSSNFSSDYANAFGTTIANDVEDNTGSSICSNLGIPMIAGLLLMGLMLLKQEE